MHPCGYPGAQRPRRHWALFLLKIHLHRPRQEKDQNNVENRSVVKSEIETDTAPRRCDGFCISVVIWRREVTLRTVLNVLIFICYNQITNKTRRDPCIRRMRLRKREPYSPSVCQRTTTCLKRRRLPFRMSPEGTRE